MPTLKNISVKPAARGSRRKAAPTPERDDEPVFSQSPLQRAARHTVPAPVHRYRVGDKLRMSPGGYSVARPASGCRVVALLPYEGHGALLYRVRSDTEAFERVVPEADLSRS